MILSCDLLEINNHMNSEINSIINEVNWNILVTSGKEIKRDSMISVNENRTAYINIRIYLIIYYNLRIISIIWIVYI